MAWYPSDLIGTLMTYFRVGKTGPRLKDSAGNLAVRNSGDTADAEVTAAKVNVSGDSIDINSDAAGTGTDRKLTLSRNPAATAALEVIFPPAKGTDGYLLRQKAGTGAGVLEFEQVAPTSTAVNMTIDTTDLAFGSTSPVTMFTLPANAVVDLIEVFVDTVFNGTAPTLSVGVSGGSASKYVASSEADLKTAAVYTKRPGLAPVGTTEDLRITYAADGSTAGAARVLVHFAVPA